jgi:hypothetical protein
MPIAKAISLRAKHALSVMYLNKRVENRSWPTKYRGSLYLHVSTKGRLTQSDREEWAHAYRIDVPSKLEGHLVATMKVVACTKEIPRGQKNWAQRGSWHFILKDVKLLRRPIKIAGQLGIWNVRRGNR